MFLFYADFGLSGNSLFPSKKLEFGFIIGCPAQEIYISLPGRYKFEVWGGRGGGLGGIGAYASGIVDIMRPTFLYAYVGGAGGVPSAGCNGGGTGGKGTCSWGDGGGGGGSTDFRFKNGSDAEALSSRIIIAAGGGGGAGSGNGKGSDGGAYVSNPSTNGAYQVSGASTSGSLLQGQNGRSGVCLDTKAEGKGAGGGGYIGGLSSPNDYTSGGTGGTSYISPIMSERLFLTGSKIVSPPTNGKAIISYIGDIYTCKRKHNIASIVIYGLLIIN